jgi:hypothetical protein
MARLRSGRQRLKEIKTRPVVSREARRLRKLIQSGDLSEELAQKAYCMESALNWVIVGRSTWTPSNSIEDAHALDLKELKKQKRLQQKKDKNNV